MGKKSLVVGCTIFASTEGLTSEGVFVKMGVIIAPQFCPDVTIVQLKALEQAAQSSPCFKEYELHQASKGNIVITVDVPAVRRGNSIALASKAMAKLLRIHLQLRSSVQMLPSQWHVAQILGGRTGHTPEE